MIRSIVLHDIPWTHVAAMERWYWRDHSPEIVRRYGPWTARHDSYLPVAAPAAASRFGLFNWRFTEGYWRDIPRSGRAGALAFTLPPVFPRVAVCFTPWQATDDILGGDTEGCARPILRWVMLHKFPAGAEAAAEHWFTGTHLPELARETSAWRVFSYRTVPDAPLPGVWPETRRPPPDHVLTGWHRVTELWFDDFDAWTASFAEAKARLTAPAWAETAIFPFLQAGKNFVSSFLLERPTDEFVRDARGYV
jgi:hypothetical protein